LDVGVALSLFVVGLKMVRVDEMSLFVGVVG
jgi:hypothetical protein